MGLGKFARCSGSMCIRFLFHILRYYRGDEYRWLYRGLRYIKGLAISGFHCTHNLMFLFQFSYQSKGPFKVNDFVLFFSVVVKQFHTVNLSTYSQNSDAAILRATDYLEKQYRNLNKPYSMALTAYALSLVNSKEKFKANDRLVQSAIYDNGTY